MDRDYGPSSVIGATRAYQVDETVAQESIKGRLNAMHDVIAHAAKIASEAETLADRIAGTQSEKNGPGGKPSAVPNGLAEQVQSILENINAHLDRAARAHQRISAALG